MFTIKFDMKGVDKYAKYSESQWEQELRRDILLKLAEKPLLCRTENDLLAKLRVVTGHELDSSAKLTFVKPVYGTQVVAYALPGICTGYVNFTKHIAILKLTGEVEIPLSAFYDSRAMPAPLVTVLNQCFMILKYSNYLDDFGIFLHTVPHSVNQIYAALQQQQGPKKVVRKASVLKQLKDGYKEIYTCLSEEQQEQLLLTAEDAYDGLRSAEEH